MFDKELIHAYQAQYETKKNIKTGKDEIKLNRIVDNEVTEGLLKRAQAVVDVENIRIKSEDSGSGVYAGLKKINLDGAIQQITIVINKTDGTKTTISRNSEVEIYIPPTPLYEIPEYDFKLIPGNHSVLITPALKPLTNQQRWYGAGGYYGGYYGGWNYGYGYYPGGDYGYYGGWGGGPLGYFGGNYYGGLGYNYFGSGGFYGPGGYNVSFYVGPYEFDADGNPNSSGPYNAQGYNSNGFDKNGFDPGGFDANGLNADGKTWGYYGVWGHLHTGTATHANSSDHKNDHGIVNFYANNVFQHTAAGSFGVANWSEGGGYVVVELEQREFWMHEVEETPTQIVTY